MSEAGREGRHGTAIGIKLILVAGSERPLFVQRQLVNSNAYNHPRLPHLSRPRPHRSAGGQSACSMRQWEINFVTLMYSLNTGCVLFTTYLLHS